MWLAGARNPTNPAPAAPGRANRRSGPRDVTLLVVDDDMDERNVLAQILEDAGYRVETAEHGVEALERLGRGLYPDLILLDLNMPIMDGYGLAAELKIRPALAGIPVVVMSGAGDAALNAAPVSAGYLTKPFQVSTLLETVESALWRRRRKSGVVDSGGGEEAD